MSNYFNLKKGLIGQLTIANCDKVVGPIKLRFSMNGNREPEEAAIKEIVKEVCEQKGFILKDLGVYNDDGFSRLIIELFDKKTILQYIEYLEGKLKEKTLLSQTNT